MFGRIVSAGVIALTAISGAANAETWTLNGETSRVSFGSIKKDKVGEAHGFSGLSGSVSEAGEVDVTIDLTSVETNIDIRNERMIEHVFKGVGEAKLSAQIDMDELNALSVGDTALVDVEGALSFVGASVDVETEMFVLRVSETQVLVTTNDMIFLSTEEAGITAGIDKLMELAKLPGITRTSPVTLRLFFNSEAKQAAAAPAASSAAVATEVAALTGDPKAGKKVFKKCKSCHSLKEGKHGAGPSLHGIIGKASASVDGFSKYSKALKAAEITWTNEALAEFLTDPKGTVKGTSMSFRGLKKPEQIDDLLAYLATE